MDIKIRALIPFIRIYVLDSIIEEESGDRSFVFAETKWIFTFSFFLRIVITTLTSSLILPNILTIYLIVCLASMANKYRSSPIMIFTALFGWTGIGLLALGIKMTFLTYPYSYGYTGKDSKVSDYWHNKYDK